MTRLKQTWYRIVILCCGLVLVLGWSTGCGETPCLQGQTRVDGKCVATETFHESPAETVQEPSLEKTSEPTPEQPVEATENPASEGITETTHDQESPTEPVTETISTPEEAMTSDMTEVVTDSSEFSGDASSPESEVMPEETPEPYGPVPTVKIVSPKNNDVIQKTSIELEVDATIASGGAIDLLELYIDGKRWSEARQTPYRFSISQGRLDDGTHTFKVVAISLGYQQASDEIKLTTVAIGPQIKFIKPQPNEAFSGAFDIAVEVKSGLALASQNGVVLKIDGIVVPWTKTAPNYEANFDPQQKPYDSLPIEVIATDSYGQIQKKQLIVIHDPAPGPKKLGEECDAADPQKRCIKDHTCLNVSGKSTCYTNCDTSASANNCPTSNCLAHSCQASHMGTTRGVCYPTGPAPGCQNYECTQSQTCDTGLICVGAGSTGTVRRWCLGTCTPGSVLLGCPQGFKCVSVGTNGVCIELCKQPCKGNSDCGVGQTCHNGVCSGPFCQAYNAPCRGVQAGTDVFDACI